jgi:histidine ammonia-lyase
VTDNPNILLKVTKSFLVVIFMDNLWLALDFMATLAELGSISERRTYQLISGTRNLPHFWLIIQDLIQA